MRVREARDHYLAENGFSVEAYESPTAQGSLFGMKFSVPNPPPHRRAIRLHDLHHVATGYGTDHAGEAELSVWQALRGLTAAGLYVSVIVMTNIAIGALAAPGRTLAAISDAGGEGSLFDADASYEWLLERSVGELRALLELPPLGLARHPRGLHAQAPSS